MIRVLGTLALAAFAITVGARVAAATCEFTNDGEVARRNAIKEAKAAVVAARETAEAAEKKRGASDADKAAAKAAAQKLVEAKNYLELTERNRLRLDAEKMLVAVAVARAKKDLADAAAKGKVAPDPALTAAASAATALSDAERDLAEALAVPSTNLVHVKNNEKVTRIAITLTNPTSERLRVSFDSRDGAHREVEWDPAVSSALTREIRLEDGDWTISVGTEPQTFNQQSGTVIIRARFGAVDTETDQSAIDGAYVAMAIAASSTTIPTPVMITAWPRPRLTFVCDAAPQQAMADLQFATSVTTSAADGSVRGLGVAPAIVTETLALLAEIAIDRARAGALKVLKDRLVSPFCDTLQTRASLRRLGLGTSSELALPRTCELLRSLRLDDVLASGRPLLIALRDDLRFTIAPAVAAKLAGGDAHLEPALRGVVSVINVAIERGGFDVLQGQLALELFTAVDHVGGALLRSMQPAVEASVATALDQLPDADAFAIVGKLSMSCATTNSCTLAELRAAAVELVREMATEWRWTDTGTEKNAIKVVVYAIDQTPQLREAVEYGCQARLVVAMIKRCSGGGCTAGDLTALVTRPADYFAPDTSLPGALCWRDKGTPLNSDWKYVVPSGDLAAIQRMAVDGLALVAPVIDGQGRERARALVRLIVQLATRTTGTASANTLAAFGDLAVAVIDEDYGTAFGRFLSLVDTLTPSTPQHRVVRKFAQLIGAVASYAVVYRDTKDTDPAAAREARKRALSSILDAFTDRTERGDEKIVSIGSNVGLSYSWRDVDQRTDSDATDDRWRPAVRVPLGVRLEHLRKRDATGRAGLGYFLSFNVIDLGQFVRSDEDEDFADVAWADFVGIGLEAGVSHAWSGRELNLSAHATYAPSIGYTTDDAADPDTDDDHRAGVWTYGVALGYYVPFIDLN